ncbi:hypothetical protein [Anaeromyxobacter terrae]|uniref:hypothetical protein n=1 Tax=Anaeromyxobacter terrae TaxID=2925406 RepID=UPI001F58B2C1|nr:hypothetical protein [Anaeromyxobacter sp. SG22]
MRPRTRMDLKVDCHAGYRGEETPLRFELEGRRVEVVEVIDRWLGPDHRYFKLRGDDGAVYLLRHDERADRWELRMFERDGA